MKQQKAQEIDEDAADWAAKVDRGLSAAEQVDFDYWLDGDVRRLGAYGRLRAIALQTERVAALGPVHSPERFVEPQAYAFSRRKLLAGGAISTCVAGLSAAGWLWLERERYRSRLGEVRQVALRDGSVITLNTVSDVSVRWSEERREVQLHEGEVLFDVARNPSRPFVVVAGSTRVQVLGTSFVVRALPGEAVQVLVQEGTVEVSRTNGEAPPSYRLVANMRAVSVAASAMVPIAVGEVPEAAVHRAIAWRDGHIDFEGETLGQAIAEFARYSDTRIVATPDLAQQEIAGLYQTSDPVGFARSVAASLRARTEITDGKILIL